MALQEIALRFVRGQVCDGMVTQTGPAGLYKHGVAGRTNLRPPIVLITRDVPI